MWGQTHSCPNCGVFRANPSPNGRGWPASAGRVRGTTYISLKFFENISLLYPSPVGRGICKKQVSESENRLKPVSRLAWRGTNVCNSGRCGPDPIFARSVQAVNAAASLLTSDTLSSAFTAAITDSVLEAGHFANSAQPLNLSATSS